MTKTAMTIFGNDEPAMFSSDFIISSTVCGTIELISRIHSKVLISVNMNLLKKLFFIYLNSNQKFSP